MEKVVDINDSRRKNVALFLTASDIAESRTQKEHQEDKEKKYGLPDGFKLIGFNVVN